MAGHFITIDRRLYLTKAGDRVVEAGDPAADRLWAAPGQRRRLADAQRLGVLDPPAAPAAKQAAPPADKQARPPGNKARRRTRSGSGQDAAGDADPGDAANSRQW